MGASGSDADKPVVQVLVIDDNEFMRRTYRELLKAFSFRDGEIQEAQDGSHALEFLMAHPVDLVICDLNMKPMNGKRFTRYIRTGRDSPDPFLPIIICTGHAERVHIEDARDAGANEILRKPVSPMSLYARLQAIVETPRPFIKSATYTGPDRRRRDRPFDGPDRRMSVVEI